MEREKQTRVSPKYGVTNEMLEAVVAGMDVQPNDRILTIGGSGDQSFALLENLAINGNGVIEAVDVLPVQIDYIKRKIEQLRKGKSNAFNTCYELGEAKYLAKVLRKALSQDKVDGEVLGEVIYLDRFNRLKALPKKEQRELIESLEEEDDEHTFKERVAIRNSYFLEPKRLERIRERLPHLKVAKRDIFCPSEQFDKIYLSNVMEYLIGREVHSDETAPLVEDVLKKIFPNVRGGGLVYYCFGEFPLQLPRAFSGWDFESTLTERARAVKNRIADYEFEPVVVRKR